MDLLLTVYHDELMTFWLVLTRLSGMMVLAPIWGSRTIPRRIRAFLAVGLALVITPLVWHQPAPYPDNLIMLAILAGCELAIGLTIGLAIKMYFAGLQLAGQLMGQMSGMSLANIASPSFDANVSVFSQMLHVLMLAIFVITGGHRRLLGALIASFQSLPIGQVRLDGSLVRALTDVLQQSFVFGLQIAAPVMVAMLLSLLIMGLISRTLPQLNILAVGFSVNGLIMLATLLLCLGVLARVFEAHSLDALEILQPVLHAGSS